MPAPSSLCGGGKDVGCSFHASARQAFHSRSCCSFGKNLGGIFASVDRTSQRRFSESLPRDSSKASDVVRHKAAGVSFHVVGVGRDGSIYSERGRSRRSLLHVWRVFGQMVRCRETMREKRRTASGGMGKAYRSEGSRSATSHWKIRYRHVDPQ